MFPIQTTFWPVGMISDIHTFVCKAQVQLEIATVFELSLALVSLLSNYLLSLIQHRLDTFVGSFG